MNVISYKTNRTTKQYQLLPFKNLRSFLHNSNLIEPNQVKHEPNRTKHTTTTKQQQLQTPLSLFHLTIQNQPTSHYPTKIMHTRFLKSPELWSDQSFSDYLVGLYRKGGDFDIAFRLFERTPQRSVVSWNMLISACNKNSLFEDSLVLFCRMRRFGFDPDENTYASVVSACAATGGCLYGEMVFSVVVKNGFCFSGFFRSCMIDLYAKKGRFRESLRVFYDDPSCENVVCWNSVISGAARNGEDELALDLFVKMCRNGSLMPNGFTFSSVLSACSSLDEIEIGKVVQGLSIKSCVKDVFLGTAIVDFYAKCGDMSEAVKEFFRVPNRNVVSWTAIISGFVRRDNSVSALIFFNEMRKHGEQMNTVTVTTLTTACAKPDMIEQASQIHCLFVKTGFCYHTSVGAALINMYSKIGSIHSSEMVLRELENKTKTSSSWAIIISSFAHSLYPQRAIELLQIMLREGIRPERVTYLNVLGVVDNLELGRLFHAYTLKTGYGFDLTVGSSLFTMYSKCSNIEDSYKVFQRIPVRDSVSWTSMIAGFAENGLEIQAFQLFRDMVYERIRPEVMTLNAILTACSGLCSLNKGKEIHGYALRAGFEREELVGSAFVSMYSKCGALKSARQVFYELPEKDEVSCSSLVSGYAQRGLLREALCLFHELLNSKIRIDSFTISSILGAVSHSNVSDIGTQLHAYVMKIGLHSDVSVGSALVTMYSRCGNIEDCSKAFNLLDRPDLIGWTAMIASYAQNGRGAEALETYKQMRRAGIRPDSVTFVGILSACSHSNLVDEGYFYFDSMTRDFGIRPTTRHYACMVDILCRSGRLKEAEKFISNMPIHPDALMWATLLASCKVHGDLELGALAAKKVRELEPRDAGTYVSLSNIYADVGQWEQVVGIRNLMKDSRIHKEPGWSLT